MVGQNRFRAALVALFVVASSAGPLAAQDVFWTAGVGDFLEPTNWDPFPPDFLTNAHINNGGTAQLGGNDIGDVAEFFLGDSSGDSGSFEMSGGQFLALTEGLVLTALPRSR